MSNNKIYLAVVETAGASLAPYLLYVENITPFISCASAIVGLFYISTKAINEFKKKQDNG